MSDKMFWTNVKELRPFDQLKFVIADKKDYDFAVNVIGMYKPKSLIYFNPVGGVNCKKLFKWIVRDKLNNVRLGVQLHKLAYDKNRRGV